MSINLLRFVCFLLSFSYRYTIAGGKVIFSDKIYLKLSLWVLPLNNELKFTYDEYDDIGHAWLDC